MQVRAEKIFPVLIPRLIATPITAFNARALASLVRVAGSALGRRLTNIVDALQGALKTEKDEDTLGEIDEALSAVLGSVSDHESGLDSLLTHILTKAKGDSSAVRVDGLVLCTKFCQVTQSDFSDYHVDFIRQLVSLFDDRAGEVVGAAWQALDALVKTIEKEDMEPLVVTLRRTIESTGTPGVAVDGFSRVNGLKPILRTFLPLSLPFPHFLISFASFLIQQYCCKVYWPVLENKENKLLTLLEILLRELLLKRSRLTVFKLLDLSVSSVVHSFLAFVVDQDVVPF